MTKDEIAKQEIVLKAQVLFQQFGMKKTTMDEIAFACGKAKSTLYHYFKSKEEVFDEVLVVEVMNLRKVVKAKVEEVRTIKEKMECYFLTFHSEVIKKMNLYRTVMREIDNDPTKLNCGTTDYRKTACQKFLTFEKDYLTRIFEDAYDSGEYMKIPKADLAHFAETLIAAFFGIVTYTVDTELEENQERIKRTAHILFDQIFS